MSAVDPRDPVLAQVGLEGARPSTQGGWVHAGGDEPVAAVAEQGPGPGRRGGAVAVVGHDAPGLIGAAAEREVLERATDVLALGDLHVAPHEQGRHEPGPHVGVVVELVGQELGEHVGALGVADEHDGPAVVEVGHVVGERVAHVGIGHRRRGGLAGGRPEVGRQVLLAVHGGVDVAHRREAGGLGHGGDQFGAGVGQVHVVAPAGLVVHGGVDVEAVDRRVGGDLAVLDARRAVGLDHGGVDVAGRAVVSGQIRTAQPVGVLAVDGAGVAGEAGRHRAPPRWWPARRRSRSGRWPFPSPSRRSPPRWRRPGTGRP